MQVVISPDPACPVSTQVLDSAIVIDAAAPGPVGADWTWPKLDPERPWPLGHAELIWRWNRDQQLAQIEAMMGLTRGQIAGRLRWLREKGYSVPPRAHTQRPGKPVVAEPPAVAPAPIGGDEDVRETDAAAGAPDAMPVLSFAFSLAGETPAEAAALVARSGRACCWPIGSPGTRNFRFCDDVSVAGKPYCETHAARAYMRAPKPVEQVDA